MSAGGEHFNAACVCCAFWNSHVGNGTDADIGIDIANDIDIVLDMGIGIDMT